MRPWQLRLQRGDFTLGWKLSSFKYSHATACSDHGRANLLPASTSTSSVSRASATSS